MTEEELMHGTILWFDRFRMYGFILGDDDQQYFVHKSQIEGNYLPREKDEVEFIPANGDKGLYAKGIRNI
jgi:CspA family cold shock protein